MDINRQPAGQPVGGQFAATQRTETGTELAEQTPDAALIELTENAFPQAEDAEGDWVISRVEAQRAARGILAGLSDDEFYNHHWFGIESAAMQVQRFEADVDGEEADAASPADTLNVDLHDYMAINGPDRAGENAYVGYDFAAFAEAVTEGWRDELKVRVARAVQANAASSAKPAGLVAA